MIQIGGFTVTWDLLLAMAVLLWAGISKGPARIWKNGIHTTKDCWTKDWEFEAHAIFRYVSILASGVYISFCFYPAGKQEMLDAKHPSLVVVIIVLICLPILFIISRRSAMYRVRKKYGGIRRPKSIN